MAANIPAAHIIQVCDPNPYHMSWSISNRSPTMMVCLEPRVFINKVNRPVCAMTEKRMKNMYVLELFVKLLSGATQKII